MCLPLFSERTVFYYLPAEPRLARRPDGLPEFSFLTYRDLSAVASEGGVTQAGGGGIVHFLVEFGTEPEDVEAAEAALRDDVEDAVLAGPVQFREGSFALVSSFLPEDEPPAETRKLSHAVVGTGRAPLLPGHKAAVSLHLTKEGATILRNSFGMAAPDIAMVFQLTYAGIRDPVEASCSVFWDKFHEHVEAEVGFKFGYGPINLGFDYENFWDKARETGAIDCSGKGTLESMQPLYERTFEILQEKVFEPVPLDVFAEDTPNLDDLATSLLPMAAGAGQQQAPWYLSLEGGFKQREIAREGEYTVNFNEAASDQVTAVLSGNIGSLYKEYAEDPRIFRTARADDPEFRVKEIVFSLDGLWEEAYRRFVTSVAVELRKLHGSGTESVREVLFNGQELSSGEPKTVTYSWDRETDLMDFERYRYSVSWSFLGGAKRTDGPIESTDRAHSLVPPFEFEDVTFRASAERLEEAGVRLVSITLWYDFFGRKRRERLELVPEEGLLRAATPIPVPVDTNDPTTIEYEIVWTLEDDSRVRLERSTAQPGTIFCDRLPEVS